MVFGLDPVLFMQFRVLLHAGHAGDSGIDPALAFDPVLLVIIAVILLVIFAFYLLIRRTATAFREGTDRGRQ